MLCKCLIKSSFAITNATFLFKDFISDESNSTFVVKQDNTDKVSWTWGFPVAKDLLKPAGS